MTGGPSVITLYPVCSVPQDVIAGSTPTIIPEEQPFPPGLLHKNATIRGNPALIRPFSPKTPGLLHRPSCPLTRDRAAQHSADNQHVKRQALPPRRGNACRLSYWYTGSYASGFCPVILSHTLEATSSITERLLSVILSASEESVTDPSLHFVPFRMTGWSSGRCVCSQ